MHLRQRVRLYPLRLILYRCKHVRFTDVAGAVRSSEPGSADMPSPPRRDTRERELLTAYGQLGDANEVLNERAVAVMKRMSDKLTGRDFLQVRLPCSETHHYHRMIFSRRPFQQEICLPPCEGMPVMGCASFSTCWPHDTYVCSMVNKPTMPVYILIKLWHVQDGLLGNTESDSVQSQVQRLILQACSHENLCQSYIGWCPFW